MQAGLVPLPPGDSGLRGYFRPAAGGAKHATIYVESDGAPWPAPDRPPDDPTPLRQVVLSMALADRGAGVAYLGRPCQFLDAEQLARCDPLLWRRGRFGEDVIAAMDRAFDRVKGVYGATTLNVVGYSGGGTVAALVSARRKDIGCLVTIAAPLDTVAWTQAIGVTPLDASLNPLDVADRLAGLPQTHFRGRQDTLVPYASGERFLARVGGARVIDVAGFDHRCCWQQRWLELAAQSCLAAAPANGSSAAGGE